MAPEWVKIGIVLDPSMLQLVTGVGEQTFQQIESLLDVAQERINAGDIVLRPNIVRVDRQGSRATIPSRDPYRQG